jgi:hypothetical protein
MTSPTQQSFNAAQQSQERFRRAFDASMEQMMSVPLGSPDLTSFVDWYFDTAEQMLKFQRQFLKSLASGTAAAREQPREL